MECSIRDHEQIKEKHEKIVQYSDDCDVLFFYDERNNLHDSKIREAAESQVSEAMLIYEDDHAIYHITLNYR